MNDLIPADNLAYLLRYATVYGRYHRQVEAKDNALTIDGRSIPLFAEKDPAALPRSELNVDLVLECTGMFREERDLMRHIEAGAKFAILSAPAKTETVATVMPGVNRFGERPGTDHLVRKLHHELHRAAGRGHGPTHRSGTGDHDDRSRVHVVATDRGRARQEPHSRAGRCGQSRSDVDRRDGQRRWGRSTRHSGRRQPPNAIAASLACPTTRWCPPTSSGDSRASVVDLNMTRVVDGTLAKVMRWYDNEWGFTHQMVRQAKEMLVVRASA